VSCWDDPNVFENVHWEGGLPMPTKDAIDAAMLNARREAMWDKLQAHRDWREQNNGTPVMVNGVQKWFHSDDPSKIKQLALVKAADLNQMPADLQWKTMDRSFVTMTNDLAYSIYIEAMMMSTQIFAVAEQHRQNLMASDNPEAYDYSGGWPQMFSEWEALQAEG
jgi:hypothetical protein